MSDIATAVPRRKRAAGAPAAPPPPAPRLPQVQRQRRLGMAAFATLLIVGFGALAGALVLRSGDRVSVVTVVQPVPAGAQLERADLGVTDVAVDGIPTVPAAQLASLVGQFATVPLISGTLLSPVAFSQEALPDRGQAVVGLQLAAGQLPSDGLRSGDVVRVVLVADNPSGAALAARSLVLVERARVLQTTSDAVNGGTAVTVLVDEAEATGLTIAAARGQVAVARVAKREG